MDQGRGQSALRGDLARARWLAAKRCTRSSTARGARWRTASRRPAGAVRRPHLGGDFRANQLRLWFSSFAYVRQGLRRLGLTRPEHRPGAVRHDPAEAAQDRRACHRLGPPHPVRHEVELPLPARVGARLRPAGRRRALTNQTAHSPQSPRPTPPHPRRQATHARLRLKPPSRPLRQSQKPPSARLRRQPQRLATHAVRNAG